MTIVVVTNTFVDVFAVESVAVVAIVALADKTSECVCTACLCVARLENAFVDVATVVV